MTMFLQIVCVIGMVGASLWLVIGYRLFPTPELTKTAKSRRANKIS